MTVLYHFNMHTHLEQQLRHFPRAYVTDVEIATLLNTSADSRHSKIKRMLASGQLLHIRRGLYCLTAELGHRLPHPFELAAWIYGTAYISLESALSYHCLIPERVYTVTCAAPRRAKEFYTPLGLFSYNTFPANNFFTEVTWVSEKSGCFFIARPWRAICDYVFCYKKDWTSMEPLEQSLRIDVEELPRLSLQEIEKLDNYYQHTRITRFLEGIRKGS